MKVGIAEFSIRKRYHKIVPERYYGHVSSCAFHVPVAEIVERRDALEVWKPCLHCFPEEREVRP